MSRSKNNRRQNREQRYRPGHSYAAHRELARINSVLREPVIRVIDRRDRYNDRVNEHRIRLRKQNNQRFLETYAPKRAARIRLHGSIRSIIGKQAYSQIHDCKKEFKTLLSWRSAQGGGAKRKRSNRELKTNERNFYKRDC